MRAAVVVVSIILRPLSTMVIRKKNIEGTSSGANDPRNRILFPIGR